ncbi:MBL fold metallo-hydrolase [Kaistella antarctica]|uniref:Hydroxyacylglutathione hydrolase n=1 Tax=Kaistella antarctica TaxID=266748 RepID=A0A448NRN5_9FLAO|nr:MBL fold metallo-hydrolase [Kaistella antarctica]KEY18723.1 metallo-beta-lactamase [Kaistella antarctica]SEW16208.1 Glyoxylase, beta-lactamase superfamily II [Kaistella antarctica]VEH99649.1 hydroxyacylglutathione hydrolase [Kaistella antarctica]
MLQIQSFAFNPFSENTYVVFNEDKDAFIIDPGNFSEEETATLIKFISDNGLKVQNILLTHAHIDHVLGLQKVYDQYQVPVLIHPLEQEMLDRNPMDANRFGFFFKPFAGKISYINENETVTLGNHEFKIIHVPGHSPGSIAFYNEAQKFMISGDVLFEGSIGRTDLYKGNHDQLITNIKTKLLVLHEETKVYNGHGNPTTIGFEKNYSPYFK